MEPTINKTHIIAFSGVAGSGKTSLVRGVVAALRDASALFCDAYRSIEVAGPNYQQLVLSPRHMIEKWFDEGGVADGYASWPLLTEHVRALKAGLAVTMPEPMWASPGCEGVGTAGGEHRVTPAHYIVLEDTWFSRTEMRAMVDLSFFIRVPLDVALARRLVRDIQQGEDILSLARQYLDIGHRYAQRVDELAASADVVLDGTMPLAEVTRQATQAIRDRFEPNIEIASAPFTDQCAE